MDKENKQRTADVRRAFHGATKRKKAVDDLASKNGVGALSAELQNQHNSAMYAVPTPVLTVPPVPKRQRIATAAAPVVAPKSTVPTAPPKRKCQGCVHGDLLDLKVMEPTHIKHYLRPAGFLELATCAGGCKKTIRAIYLASPKALLYYCDENIKGFSAPDDDPAKAEMECGMIVCSPCHAMRETRYTQEQNRDGTVNRRTSRRGTNR